MELQALQDVLAHPVHLWWVPKAIQVNRALREAQGPLDQKAIKVCLLLALKEPEALLDGLELQVLLEHRARRACREPLAQREVKAPRGNVEFKVHRVSTVSTEVRATLVLLGLEVTLAPLALLRLSPDL